MLLKRGFIILIIICILLTYTIYAEPPCGVDFDTGEPIETCTDPQLNIGTADEVKTYCTTNTCSPEQLNSLTDTQKKDFWSNPDMAGKYKDKLTPANVKYLDTSNPEVLNKVMPINQNMFEIHS